MRAIVYRFFAALALFTPLQLSAATPGVAMVAVKGTFDDVKERVVTAIENRGLVLNYTARIGDMLERTGKDIGRATPVYGKAELVEFCSARVSRDTMEADPHNIVFCPYAIAIYTLPREPGRVYVSYRKLGSGGSPPSDKALRAVERLLDDIVREATK
jgi:uncharacterized protein (DUF302 family)